ncbi:ABC transporter permease [Tuwongella immobilis]|uniref:Uncharacterized protein n=1 Tax=Tuwongella immobilis TaxID=692036 RepID=A0A6C2YJM4_9BACT|nr:ABC transporter permease [Tuwongella immobilis]VIP01574.1 abc transporter permease : Uncharacterized protein OS=Pirellula staleyi (strain ATCC 27377 / DSM 6068 / ICPB 4128) GN=Psta_1007 PE=4 SV=1: MacB_PCD: FtsX [Tuwongella immobilis]VTR98813.1 abc transporter permease : Uncharacterized protein OS=Pirellula staleyi (strain ATCC 27377 / DSM 6068 / ICPB 4128) GN=Psta_1007 PE=4 SV=1: MacB_PCD: FtsX [Tuwongella immobilis]
MIWIALKMLTGDRAKYFGIVFGVAFASLLMGQQTSLFISLLGRTVSQIRDFREVDIWVADPKVRYIDEPFALAETDVARVRSVPGVDWAVKLFKGNLRARLAEPSDGDSKGDFRTVLLLGVDDTTLMGVPREFIPVDGKVPSPLDLKQPDAVFIDEPGYTYLFPGQPFQLGRMLEMNDRRAKIVGICKTGAPFTSVPVVYARYSQAMQFAPPERRLLSLILVGQQPGADPAQVCENIRQQTGLAAYTTEEFKWKTIQFFLDNTGIPINFGITVMLGFIVGVAIAGQTFYLFTLENLKQFGALKAMGVSNLRIVGMIITQGVVVGVVGYGIGMGMAAMFFENTKDVIALQGFAMCWEVLGGSALAVLAIVTFASLFSIRKVIVLEPAVVFR